MGKRKAPAGDHRQTCGGKESQAAVNDEGLQSSPDPWPGFQEVEAFPELCRDQQTPPPSEAVFPTQKPVLSDSMDNQTREPLDSAQGVLDEVHPNQLLEIPASPMKALTNWKRRNRESPRAVIAPPIGLSPILEEKNCCEEPLFADGTPAAVLRRLGSTKVMTRKPAALSEEKQRLEHVLRFIGGDQLREQLALALGAEDNMVEKLAELLPEERFPGKAENLEECYLCDKTYDPTYTKGNMLFVCRNCMSQHRERESLDGRGEPCSDRYTGSCTNDEDCLCLQCMEKMPDEQVQCSEEMPDELEFEEW